VLNCNKPGIATTPPITTPGYCVPSLNVAETVAERVAPGKSTKEEVKVNDNPVTETVDELRVIKIVLLLLCALLNTAEMVPVPDVVMPFRWISVEEEIFKAEPVTLNCVAGVTSAVVPSVYVRMFFNVPCWYMTGCDPAYAYSVVIGNVEEPWYVG